MRRLKGERMPMPNHCIDCDKVATVTLDNVPYCSLCGVKALQENPLSNCCSSPFTYPGWPDSDFCSKCHEHASTWEDEDG